jgi:hypothetical protein
MKLQDLENIEDYYIDEGFLCIKLISGDHLRINFNSIEAIKKQFSLQGVSHQRELLLQAYKDGFDSATESLLAANKIVQDGKLQ